MILLACPFLKQPVRLSKEREERILTDHLELAPDWPDRLAEVLADPDEIRWSNRRPGTLVFGRWYPALLHGQHILAVVVLDATGRQEPWLVTAYVARHWRGGTVAWRRN